MSSVIEASPRATRVLLVRHAHVDTGPAPGILCGCLDLPLSRTGYAQLAAVRSRLGRIDPPVALYTSTLMRARQTADALARTWQLSPRLERELREIDCGQLEGVPIERLEREYPDLWARNSAQTDDDFTWPGGEAYREFRRRALAAVARIAAAHCGERIAVVTHTGVITQVLGVIRQRPPAAWAADRPDPLTITEITWGSDGPEAVLRVNDGGWD